MDTLVLINKPTGISSAKIGGKVKINTGIKKIGHVGTLDVEASGLLLLLTGRATRLQSHLLHFDKEYKGYIRLGVTTTTDDMFGEILTEADTSFFQDSTSWSKHEELIKNTFKGSYLQVAPNVSAKKTGGEPDYKKVRRGEMVTRKSKEVSVEILDFYFESESRIFYNVRVSTGFYVRSFARDVGEILGVGGAAESIERTRIGPFLLEDALPISEMDSTSLSLGIGSSFAMTLENIFHLLPYPGEKLVDEGLEMLFKSGNVQALESLGPAEDYLVVYNSKEVPLGLVRNEDSRLRYDFVL
jgi:tRNA pseudouridine55 synthase